MYNAVRTIMLICSKKNFVKYLLYERFNHSTRFPFPNVVDGAVCTNNAICFCSSTILNEIVRFRFLNT